ncbi:MAG: HEAT repeat domain-containing protein [Myxococcota bacterium]
MSQNPLRPSGAAPRIVVLLATMALFALFFVPSTAAADGGAVRYSYEQAEVGDAVEWVLVPRSEKALNGDVDKAKLEKAFGLLKKDKSATYGNSSVQISGRVPDRARVTVKIDPDFSQYALIIMAETVYTMTEFGVEGVRFPGHRDGVMSRQDVPFASYTLTVPLWKFVPPSGIAPAQVRMPDGSLADTPDIAKRWKRGDEQLQEAFFSYLDADETYTVIQALERVPKLEIPFVDQVIPLLEHKNSGVRAAALEVLAEERDEEKVLAAVVDMMREDEKEKMARAAAEFLGKAKDSKYSVLQQFFLLERGSPEEAAAAAKQLGGVDGDQRVVDKLYSALRSEQAEVAKNAAVSLEKLDADAAQEKALEDDAIAATLKTKIAEELAADRDKDSKLVGLTYLAENEQGRPAHRAIEALGAMRSDESRAQVEAFLTSADERKRRIAADTLLGLGESASLEAFGEAIEELDDADYLRSIAYELTLAQPLSTITELAESRQNVVKRLAFRALGKKAVEQGAGQDVFDKLVDGTTSRDDGIRAASARALGAYANDKALDVLEKLADDGNAEVRAGVAHALGNYESGQMYETLAGYLEDESPEVVAAAIGAMEARNEATKWDDFRKMTKSESPEVRAAAYKALANLVSEDDKQGLRNVISMLSGAVNDEAEEVQLTAMRELGDFEDEKAVSSIALQLNADEKRLRLTSIRSLAETGHPTAFEPLASVLTDPDPEIRRAAIEALGEFGGSKAKSRLKSRLEDEEDEELRRLIESTLRKL